MNDSFIAKYLSYCAMTERLAWQPERIRDLQLEKINGLLKKIGSKNGRVKAIKSLEEMSAVPLMTKQHLRTLSQGFKADTRWDEALCLTTSGTTGSGVPFFISRKENMLRAAAFFRMMRFNGYLWSDPILALVESQYARLKKKAWYHGIGLARESAIDHAAAIDEQVKLFLKTRPAILRGRMRAVRDLAKELMARGLKRKLKRVFVTGGQLTPDVRMLIREAFDCPVVDYYSATECGVIAWECPEQEGYHIDMDNVFLELIPDHASGRHRIVVTSLNALTFPVIRYSLDDLSSGSADRCACGCRFPKIRDIKGHKTEYENFR